MSGTRGNVYKEEMGVKRWTIEREGNQGEQSFNGPENKENVERGASDGWKNAVKGKKQKWDGVHGVSIHMYHLAVVNYHCSSSATLVVT